MNNKDLLFQQPQQQVVEENMSNLTSASGEASVSSGNRTEASGTNSNPQNHQYFSAQLHQQKRKRNQPGNPDPDAEVIALSPKTLVATNRFVCEICNKGFQRDQNLQLHRRGHNLPWKLKQRANKDVIRKKVYVCPEPSCVHHDPSRALGDLTGIKKHFFRKHGEKKWKCEKCSKRYAVQSDWKAHSKTCGTREYRCDCGTLFSRRDSFITHRAFCDVLAEESARSITTPPNPLSFSSHNQNQANINLQIPQFNNNHNLNAFSLKKEEQQPPPPQSDHLMNYTLTVNEDRQIIPPWLAPPQAQPPPLDQSSSPLIFSHHLDLSPQSPNPVNNISGLAHAGIYHPPSFPQASPHMSATALLQKASQMGPTVSQQQGHAAADEGSGQRVTTTMAATLTSATPGFGLAGDFGTRASANYSNASLFQDYMMNSGSGFDNGSSFEETFGVFLRTNAATTNGAKSGGGGGGGEDLTRDFLGLRPLSHSDILSFAGLGNCISTTSHCRDDKEQQEH